MRRLKIRISNEGSSWPVTSGLGQCDAAAGRRQHGAPPIWFQAEIQSACRYLLWPWPPVGPKQSIIQPLCCDTQKQMNIGGTCQQKSHSQNFARFRPEGCPLFQILVKGQIPLTLRSVDMFIYDTVMRYAAKNSSTFPVSTYIQAIIFRLYTI
jgi:hypothetical protein